MSYNAVTMKRISFGISDSGIEREQNEDNFVINDDLDIYVVADGMGGHHGGKIAAEIAVNCINEFFKHQKKDNKIPLADKSTTRRKTAENLLLSAIRQANRRIFQLGSNNPVYAGMGTTIVALYIFGDMALIANVGDSRGYLIRQNAITQLTTDHSWINEQLKKGLISPEEARQHRWRNIITRALGSKREVEIDINRHPIEPGDYFLLCTDGLTSQVEDDEIRDVITQERNNIEIACEKLVSLAKKRGGPDNITVVLVHFLPE